MSKLDEILDKDFDCIAAGFRIHQLTDADARFTKQQIKDLMNELIGDIYAEDASDLAQQLCQKVEEL